MTVVTAVAEQAKAVEDLQVDRYVSSKAAVNVVVQIRGTARSTEGLDGYANVLKVKEECVRRLQTVDKG